MAERVAAMRETKQGVVAWIAQRRAALPCASCQQPMDTLLYRGIMVDRCTAHGLWFDRGELEALLLSIGGVVAATSTAVAATSDSGGGLVGGVVDTGGGILDGLSFVGDALQVVVDVLSLFDF